MVELRPHHVTDIVCLFGEGCRIRPGVLGHDVHRFASMMRDGIDFEVRFVVRSDDICAPCSKLGPDGRCVDVLAQLAEKPSKQDYNDSVDAALSRALGFEPGAEMTMRAYLELVRSRLGDIGPIVVHPGQDAAAKLRNLEKGLASLLDEPR